MAKKKKGAKKKGGKKKATSSATGDVKLPQLAPTVDEKLWKARFAISEQARREHRENASTLIQANAVLETQMVETERDTMDVVAYLRRDLAQCEDKLKQSKDYVAEMKRQAQQQIDVAVDECNEKVTELEQQLKDRALELDNAHKELADLREFKYTRDTMEKQIFELQEEIKRQKQTFGKEKQVMETKFFEEKARVQKATEIQLESLAQEAHKSAVRNLNITTRHTFEENERLLGEMKFHISEVADFKQSNALLQEDLRMTTFEMEEKSAALNEQVVLVKNLKSQNTTLHLKVASLEQRLSESMRSHAHQLMELREEAEDDMKELKYNLELTQQSLNLKGAELRRIKTLARNVLHQRTLVEQFFLDSINHVRKQIAHSRAVYAKAAKNQYNEAMREGHKTGAMPQVKTFVSKAASSNDINSEFEAANNLHVNLDDVELESLTWEQREQVLRQLFAKMNGSKLRKNEPKAKKVSVDQQARILPTPPAHTNTHRNVQQKLLQLTH
eukprot:m.20860 g.20860  ORF g.20860 m.20860 type:complete len:503 (-) comp5292_c0_seq2:185-1693(-)